MTCWIFRLRVRWDQRVSWDLKDCLESRYVIVLNIDFYWTFPQRCTCWYRRETRALRSTSWFILNDCIVRYCGWNSLSRRTVHPAQPSIPITFLDKTDTFQKSSKAWGQNGELQHSKHCANHWTNYLWFFAWWCDLHDDHVPWPNRESIRSHTRKSLLFHIPYFLENEPSFENKPIRS